MTNEEDVHFHMIRFNKINFHKISQTNKKCFKKI